MKKQNEKWNIIIESAAKKSNWLMNLATGAFIGFVVMFLFIFATAGLQAALFAALFTAKYLLPVLALIAIFGRFVLLPGLALILRCEVAYRYLNLFIHPIHTISTLVAWYVSRTTAVPLSPPRFTVLA